MVRFIKQSEYDFTKNLSQKNTQPSLTQQGRDLSVKDIIKKSINGGGLPIRKKQYGGDGMIITNYDDITDIHAAISRGKETQERLKQEAEDKKLQEEENARQDAITKQEAEKAEFERLKSKYGQQSEL